MSPRRVFSFAPPASPNNKQGWDAIMGGVADVRSVLFMYCPEAVLEQRLLSRGKSSGRTDDNAETAKRRFQTYVETTLPVSEPPPMYGLYCIVPYAWRLKSGDFE